MTAKIASSMAIVPFWEACGAMRPMICGAEIVLP
jgi:hypothetical protein